MVSELIPAKYEGYSLHSMGTRKTTPIRFKISEKWQTVVLLDIVQLHLHHEDADADYRLRSPGLKPYCTGCEKSVRKSEILKICGNTEKIKLVKFAKF